MLITHIPVDIAIPYLLRPDEHIASINATVIADDNGNVTGWIDNNKTMMMIGGENGKKG